MGRRTKPYSLGFSCQLESHGFDRQLWRFRHCAQTSSYVRSTLVPVAGEAIFLMLRRPVVAVS
jgi:hypothetical protein